jgi:hypothetical protein
VNELLRSLATFLWPVVVLVIGLAFVRHLSKKRRDLVLRLGSEIERVKMEVEVMKDKLDGVSTTVTTIQEFDVPRELQRIHAILEGTPQ